jgi:dihydrofolate reductase
MLPAMANLIYTAIASLDGYIADENGNFDWAEPDEEVHRFVNDLERPVGTYLIGRRLYEVMSYWETAHTVPGQPDVMLDYAQVWQAADKVVYSRTLETPATARTRVERNFDPGAPVVVGGGTRAFPDGLSLRLELVDERRFGNGVVYLRYRTSEEEP